MSFPMPPSHYLGRLAFRGVLVRRLFDTATQYSSLVQERQKEMMFRQK